MLFRSTRDRAELDFERARDVLEEIYEQLIRDHYPRGTRVQLYIVVMLDPPPSLVESEAKWVEGEAEPD